jgi:hypothetical protein
VNVNEVAEMASVPQSLYMFMNLLLGGQSHLEKDEVDHGFNKLDELKKTRIPGIGQDIVYGVCGGSWNNLDADFGSWMLDFASLDCTAWIQSRLHA